MFRNAHKLSFLASSRMFSRIKGTGDKSLPTNDFSKALTGDVPFVKRKVALVCSFVGTNYKGMQYNPGTSTIESNLISSLTEIGCILPSNSLDPSKISWSRSSRTDKGVHAARLIVAAKLEVHPKWINEITLKLKEVPRLVNEKLPPDIRVFSCVKVNGSFDARYEVDWREYEYIIPLDVLTLNTSALTDKGELHTPDDLLGRLNAQLVKMEGTHSFHNFHRESAKKNNRIPKKKDDQNSPYVEAVEPVPQTFDSSDTEDSESIEDDDDDDVAVDQEGESNVNGQKSIDPFIKHSDRRYLENWQPVERSSSHRETKTIFRMRASLFELSCAGDQKEKQTMVRIAVKGNSFLLHQIRIMVSTAILATRGDLPTHTIDTALRIPFRVPMAMAPAEGLVLLEAGFMGGKINGKTLTMAPTSSSTTTVRTANDNMQLMDGDEYSASEEFKNQYISERIRDDWLGDDQRLLREWLETCRMFEVNDTVAAEWRDLLVTYTNIQDEKANEQRSKKYALNVVAVENFRETSMPLNFTTVANYLADWSLNNSRNSTRLPRVPKLFSVDNAQIGRTSLQKLHKGRIISYKELLPKGTALGLCIAFGVTPDPDLLETLRVLATRVVTGELSVNLSVQQLVEEVKRGALEARKKTTSNQSNADELNAEDLRLWTEGKLKHVLIQQ